MKKYQYLLIVFALALFSGCEKLDREFVTSISRNELEQSFTNVQALLTAIYSDLPDGTVYIGGGPAMMASASDEAEFTNESNAVQSFNTGGWNAINNPDLVWGTYYRGIRKVDQFLLSTGNINLDQYKNDPAQAVPYANNLAIIKRWTFEARFLRAFFYFELVKRYGGVPLLNDALAINGDFSGIARNTLDSCIKFISNECDSAALNLPLTSVVTSGSPYTANDLNRASKLAALALKSRVLLYAASDLFNTPSWAGGYAKPELISLPAGDRNARWKAASDAALAVINAGAVPTLGAYKTVFNNFNLGTFPEIIFCRSNSAAGNNNQFERNNSPIGYPGAGANANTPSQDMVDAYDVIVNATTTAKFDWTNPAMAAAPYANRDPRLEFTIIRNDTAFGVTPAGRTNNRVQLFTGGLDGKPVLNASKTGYYLRKYQQESLNITLNNIGSHSWIFFRYPEIFLNYAEALNEWSPGNADIKKYYDLVRTRTGVAMPVMTAATLANQGDAREKIRNEARVEFAFEDHRFWDVRRWMQAPTYFNAPLRGVDITRTSVAPTAFSYSPNVIENRVFVPKMYLYPIPQSDLSVSPALVQNPLW